MITKTIYNTDKYIRYLEAKVRFLETQVEELITDVKARDNENIGTDEAIIGEATVKDVCRFFDDQRAPEKALEVGDQVIVTSAFDKSGARWVTDECIGKQGIVIQKIDDLRRVRFSPDRYLYVPEECLKVVKP